MRPVNLLPEGLRRGAPGAGESPVSAYVFLGSLAALVLMALGLVVTANQTTTATDKAAELRAKTVKAAPQKAKVQPFLNFAGVVRSRTITVAALAELRFPWHVAMYNLARALPDDVTLDSVAATSSATAAPAAAAPASPADAAQIPTAGSFQIAGCASTHVGVARMLVRMRAMPGVATATLANSTRPGVGGETGAAAPAAGAAGGGRSQNCGKRPATFAIEIKFKQLKVDLAGLDLPDAPPTPVPAAVPTGPTTTAAAG